MHIPRVCFTFWEGSQFSPLHYATIYSLHKLNPDMDIVIYSSKSFNDNLIAWDSGEQGVPLTNVRRMGLVSRISPNVKIVYIDFKAEYGLDNNISPVFKADIIRICKLHEHGGLWFDFDILFIKPIPSFFFESDDVDMFYFIWAAKDGSWSRFTTGIVASIPGTDLLTRLRNVVVDIAKDIGNRGYQKLGPVLWNNTVLGLGYDINKTSRLLSNDLVYPYDWLTVTELVTTNKDRVSSDTFCIHWFNGNNEVRKFQNELNLESINPAKSTLHKYLHKVFMQA